MHMGFKCLYILTNIFSFSGFFSFLFYIGVELINDVVLVSGVKQGDSDLHIHISILFLILFPIR